MSLGDNDATARVEAVTLAKDVGFSPRNSSKVQWGARLLRLWDGERERKSARKLCRLGTSAIPQKNKKKKREKVSRDPPRSWWRIQTEVFFLIERQKKTEIQKLWRCLNQRLSENQIEILPPSYPHHKKYFQNGPPPATPPSQVEALPWNPNGEELTDEENRSTKNGDFLTCLVFVIMILYD